MDDNGLLEAYEHNKRVIDVITGYLLENEMFADSDIDDTNPSPETAAQSFINVYNRLRAQSKDTLSPGDVPTYVNDGLRYHFITQMDDDELLAEYGNAMLKKGMLGDEAQVKLWEEYYLDLQENLKVRLQK